MNPFPGANQYALSTADPKGQAKGRILRHNDQGLWNLPQTDMPPIIGYGSHHQPMFDPNEPAPRDIDPGISRPFVDPHSNPQIQNMINALMGKRI